MRRECTHAGSADRYAGERMSIDPHSRRRLSLGPARHGFPEPRPAGLKQFPWSPSRAVVEPFLNVTAYGAMSLFGFADAARRFDRKRFWSAALVACMLIVGAYAMDWFLFGTVQFAAPHYFPIVAAGALACRLPILGIRRLRDTGRSGWLVLGLLVPVAGWLVLVRWWCAPSVDECTVVRCTRCSTNLPYAADGNLPMSRASCVCMRRSNVKG